MDFQQHLDEIQEHARAKLNMVLAEIIGSAVAMIKEDIHNPDLTGPNAPPDMFMLRANQIGMALFQNRAFALAESLYRALVKETLTYRQQTGAWRHAGALYANTAGACAAQGNIDQAVIELLKAAQEDVTTYKVKPSDSFAIKGLLQEYFGGPIRNKAWKAVLRANPSLSLADVESECRSLGEREYAFLAYVYLASVHEEANQQSPNEFSQLQLFSALRSLSSLLEVELKTIAGNMQTTLFPACETLYKTKKWWTVFDGTRKAIGATQGSNRAVDDQLKDAIAIIPTDGASIFWKSLLVAYIVRNYTTHQMEAQCALVRFYSQEALGHILHVMITASKHT